MLSGTPSAASCGRPLTVTVNDSSTPVQTASATFQYDAAGFNEELLEGQVGVFYDNVIQFQCATDPISWSLVSGSLPPGLQMMPFSPASPQLNFRGTPTRSGVFSLKVQAQDGSNRTAQQSASVTILPSALVITDSVMQLGVVNQTFDHTLKTTGGTPPYNFSLSSGSLAAGLQLNVNTGEISGIPTAPGFYQFNISVTDRTSPTAFSFAKPYTILVTPATLSPRNDSLATATPIFPGTYTASLSPYADFSGNAAPDHDYYSLIVNGSDIYAIGAVASYNLGTSATNPGPMTSSADPAIEILDSTGTRMMTCNDPIADNPPSGAPITKGARHI